MGGHNTQVFSVTPVRITFEYPVSVVLRGDTLEWISAPQGRPSAHARCDAQKICGLFGIFASQRATGEGHQYSIPACSQPSNSVRIVYAIWAYGSARLVQPTGIRA